MTLKVDYHKTGGLTVNQSVEVSKEKLELVSRVLKNMAESLNRVAELLSLEKAGASMADSLKQISDQANGIGLEVGSMSGEVVMEGVFDGVKLISQNGDVYDVPANYASKSKLVEGDILKLTIRPNGALIYKQIAPTDRQRIIGTLLFDEYSGQYYVMAKEKAFKVNPAAVTYYKCSINDEVILLVPKDGMAAWGALEGVARK